MTVTTPGPGSWPFVQFVWFSHVRMQTCLFIISFANTCSSCLITSSVYCLCHLLLLLPKLVLTIFNDIVHCKSKELRRMLLCAAWHCCFNRYCKQSVLFNLCAVIIIVYWYQIPTTVYHDLVRLSVWSRTDQANVTAFQHEIFFNWKLNCSVKTAIMFAA